MRWQRLISLSALTAALAGCGTVTHWTPAAESEFSGRRAADVQLSEPITLFDFPPRGTVGLISGDGHAHVIAIDHDDGVHHAEVDGAGVIRSKRIGEAPKASRRGLDVVEFPPQTLRVLAGTSQFVRDPTTMQWQEFKGNRCVRFVKAVGRLYCGFVLSGEEFGTPTRTDVYGGLFIIIPFVLPVPRQSEKLVLAELVDATWTVRFVIDADDALDASAHFLMDADREGNIHVLYTSARGGALFFYYGIVDEPRQSTRYVLVEKAALEQAAQGPHDAASRAFAGLKGKDVVRPTRFRYTDKDVVANFLNVGPWLWETELNPVSGAFEALISGDGGARRGGESVSVRGLFTFQVSGGEVGEQLSLVVPQRWPTDTYFYFWSPSLKIDSDGTFHAVIYTHPKHSEWGVSEEVVISYFARRSGLWSLPIRFPVSVDLGFFNLLNETKLLVVGAGRVFVGWAQKGIGLQGRWIHSRESSRQ